MNINRLIFTILNIKGTLMAHSRKDTYVAPPEWWKHLRPFNKRYQAHRERQAAKKRIANAMKEAA